ncbi:Precorrin-6A reductase [Frankia canadensis]|uniref:Precorrin-6A reductase n=1 Tax=Frankia canadensis TaxID=1836972 RepID=A0A2I2KRJ1_9ACTN|nr:cobalt-precorrin-6A reductase [Frankia canadensis]SNQ48272.1 Precorrin-6A reductase [Frankia canadensis]SOU55562.1 Precorrin-6A reductase [Frankia canadensis]
MTRRVLVLGGTGEARRLATALVGAGAGAGAGEVLEVLYSLAGRVREPAVPPSCEVRVGGFGGPDGLAALLRARRITAIIDATHPFAARMSASAATASAATGVPLLVLRRPGWQEQPGDDWRRVPALPAAVALLDALAPASASQPGADAGQSTATLRVFLTTGRTDLALFASLHRPWFLSRSVEPPDGPVPPRLTVILDRGPFDVAAETELLRRHAIDVLVTKDSGGTMTAAKLTATRHLGVPVIMIDRPPTPPGVGVVGSVGDAVAWLTTHATTPGKR